MTTIFDKAQIGKLTLQNRILMAPMTRGRAERDGTPTEKMIKYYVQRASAGLIITEATPVSPNGIGWVGAPGIYTDSHEQGWKKIVSEVHKAGGLIFLQLWHMGRVSHPDFLNNELPVAPSAITAQGESHTPNGKKPYVQPRALTTDEIKEIIQAYSDATKRAKNAGFDGVEIHAANGYLIDQFLRDGSNQRKDGYGGTIENRVRFLLEVTEAVINSWDADHVGVRLSPTNAFNDMKDSDPIQTFTHAAERLNIYDLAYLHILEALPGHFLYTEGVPIVGPKIRKVFKNPLILNGGYDKETGNKALQNGEADLIAYGIPYIANPDLPERFRTNATLNTPEMDSFYGGGEKGYTDYPFLEKEASKQK